MSRAERESDQLELYHYCRWPRSGQEADMPKKSSRRQSGTRDSGVPLMDLSNLQSLDVKTVDQVCDLARDPAAAPQLTEFLGNDQYQQLRDVVQDASRSPSRGATGTIILLHGIMG